MPDSPFQSLEARCRLIPDFNISAAVLALCTLLILSLAASEKPPKNEEIASFLAMVISIGAIPIYWLVARFRGAIVFDQNGARWRTAFGRWKSARWDEIQSCDARLTSTTTQWKYVVSTQRGEFSWTRAFCNSDKLAPFAAQFCPKIPPEIENWPRRFHYRGAENFLIVLSFPIFGGWLLAPIWALFASSPQHWLAQWELYAAFFGGPLALFGILLFCLAVQAIPALMLLIYARAAQNFWRHRDEVLQATPRGLSWQKAGRALVFAAWDEVEILHCETRGKFLGFPSYRLQTARGEMVWNSHLSGFPLLARTLRERAPHLKETTSRALSNDLGEAPEMDGETVVFNFKTRELRAILAGGLVLSLAVLTIAIFGPIQPARGEPAPSFVIGIFAFLLIAATICGARLFQSGEIRLDARGLEWKMPLRRRFIAWSEIEGLNLKNGVFLVVGGRKVRLFDASLRPAHFEILLREIEMRAGQS